MHDLVRVEHPIDVLLEPLHVLVTLLLGLGVRAGIIPLDTESILVAGVAVLFFMESVLVVPGGVWARLQWCTFVVLDFRDFVLDFRDFVLDFRDFVLTPLPELVDVGPERRNRRFDLVVEPVDFVEVRNEMRVRLVMLAYFEAVGSITSFEERKVFVTDEEHCTDQDASGSDVWPVPWWRDSFLTETFQSVIQGLGTGHSLSLYGRNDFSLSSTLVSCDVDCVSYWRAHAP
jgi:hypothetical protein